MAYGNGFIGGFTDTGGADNTTLAGNAQWILSQVAELVGTLALASATTWNISQAANLGLNPMRFSGQSDWVLSQSADLVLPPRDMSLTGSAAFTISQTGQIVLPITLGGNASFITYTPNADMIMIMKLAGNASFITATPNMNLILFVLMGGKAVIGISASGALFVLRAPLLPPAKISESLVKRRSLLMPYPALGPTGRPL